MYDVHSARSRYELISTMKIEIRQHTQRESLRCYVIIIKKIVGNSSFSFAN